MSYKGGCNEYVNLSSKMQVNLFKKISVINLASGKSKKKTTTLQSFTIPPQQNLRGLHSFPLSPFYFARLLIILKKSTTRR